MGQKKTGRPRTTIVALSADAGEKGAESCWAKLKGCNRAKVLALLFLQREHLLKHGMLLKNNPER